MKLYDFLEDKNFITIVGNGFDLNHNIETKYSDFLEKDSKSTSAHFVFLRNQNTNLDWIDVEEEITRLHSQLLNLHDQLTFISVGMIGKFYVDNIKYEEFIRTNVVGHDIVNMYTKILTGKNYKNSLKMIIATQAINNFGANLIKDFNIFINEFKKYLKQLDIANLTLKNDQLTKLIRLSKHFICYNYTSTLMHFTDRSKITYVHGNLEDGIVLGMPYNKCDLRMKKISKEIKVHEMGFSLSDDEINVILDRRFLPGGYSILNNKFLVVVGHSLGQSDSHNLLRLFNNEFSKIFILYHEKYVKVDLMINLFELLGKEEAEKQIASQRIEFIYFRDI